MGRNNNDQHQDPLELVNEYEEQIREWAKGRPQSGQAAINILEECLTESIKLANHFYGVKELEGVYPAIPPSQDFNGILEKAIQLKNQNIRIRMLSWIEVYTTAQLEQLKAAAELIDMIIDDCRNKRKVKPLEPLRKIIEVKDFKYYFDKNPKIIERINTILIKEEICDEKLNYLLSNSRKHYLVHALAKAITNTYKNQFTSYDTLAVARSLFAYMNSEFHIILPKTQAGESYRQKVADFTYDLTGLSN